MPGSSSATTAELRILLPRLLLPQSSSSGPQTQLIGGPGPKLQQSVLEEMECQPCHGYFCEKFELPECIKRVPVDQFWPLLREC